MVFTKDILKPILLALALGNTTACSTVTLSSTDGKAVFKGLMGTRLVELDSYPLVVTSRGFGIVTKADGLTIGWIDETRIHVSGADDRCRAVIITDKVEEMRNVITALGRVNVNLSEICIVNQGKTE